MRSPFDSQKLLEMMNRARKGPAQQRRLARRLLERQRKRDGISPPVPVSTPPTIPTPKTPEQIKETRITRHAKKARQRIRQRQLMAARSGLHELVRRVPPAIRAEEATRRQGQADAAAEASKGLPLLRGGDYGTAEECNELPSSSKRKAPLEAHTVEVGYAGRLH